MDVDVVFLYLLKKLQTKSGLCGSGDQRASGSGTAPRVEI
jgi:hypothetical protein